MQKQNYKVIADIVRRVLLNTPYFHQMVDLLCSYFGDDNPLFKENKFRKACRVGNDAPLVDYTEKKAEKKIVEKGGEPVDIVEKLKKYQDDVYGADAATDRMNEKFKKLNEKIRKEKEDNKDNM